ncbi:MAG: GGDEF domain-containing protein [Pseudomonadota bacterium]
MTRNRFLLRFSRPRLLRAIGVFVAVIASALCLTAIFAGYVARIGVPVSPQEFFWFSMGVTALVAFPLAVVAAQYCYRLAQYRASLEAFASTDSLTGLLNRLYFEYAAEDERMRMGENNTQGAIAVFKLNDFKTFNEAYGHDAGDVVLKAVAEIAFNELRGPFDKLARRGGAEFLILLSNLTLEQAIGVCERIAQRITNTRFQLDGQRLDVSTCFGVAHFMPDSDIGDVIVEADSALTEAERMGPNRVYSSIGPGNRVRLVLVN